MLGGNHAGAAEASIAGSHSARLFPRWLVVRY